MPIVLRVADSDTLERIEDAHVELATTNDLAGLSADEFLNASSVLSGRSDSNGCVEMNVLARIDPSSFGMAGIRMLFNRFWVARVSANGRTETVLIETTGSSIGRGILTIFRSEGEVFTVSAIILSGQNPDLDATACSFEPD